MPSSTAPNSPINPATDDLGTLGGTVSYGYDINASGQVVGFAFINSGENHAFRTAPNSPINPATDDLWALGGLDSEAHGINAFGQVVGVAGINSVKDFHASDGFVSSTAAPIASGWGEPSSRAGLSPAVDQRLFTAHV